MNDHLEDYILFDAFLVTEDNYCRRCMIGILEAVSDIEMICDICNQRCGDSADAFGSTRRFLQVYDHEISSGSVGDGDVLWVWGR